MDPPRSVLAQSHGSARRYKRRRPWPSEPAVALTFPAIARGLTPSRGLSGQAPPRVPARIARSSHVLTATAMSPGLAPGHGLHRHDRRIAGLAQAAAAAPLSALIGIRSPRRRP